MEKWRTNLGGKLGTKTLAHEDGVPVHKHSNTTLHAIHHQGFHYLQRSLSNGTVETHKLSSPFSDSGFGSDSRLTRDDTAESLNRRFSFGGILEIWDSWVLSSEFRPFFFFILFFLFWKKIDLGRLLAAVGLRHRDVDDLTLQRSVKLICTDGSRAIQQ